MGLREQPLGQVQVVALAADLATVRAPRGLPPGTRVRFCCATSSSSNEPPELTGKVVRLERDGDDYLIGIRVNSLSREARRAVLNELERAR